MSCDFWDPASMVGVSCDEIVPPAPRGTVWVQRTAFGSRNWNCLDTSSDGLGIVAGVWNGYIYLSTDGGVTATQLTAFGSRQWMGVTISDDKLKIAASDYATKTIWSSTDGGATATQQPATPLLNFDSLQSVLTSLAGSNNGSNLIGGQNLAGFLYSSANSGVAWSVTVTPNTPSGHPYGRFFTSNISPDGTFCAAWDDFHDVLFTGTPGGTLTQQSSLPGVTTVYSLGLSLTGSKIITSDVLTGYTKTSSNYGVTFTQQQMDVLNSFDCSDSGTLVIGVDINNPGVIKLSDDSGVTFTASGSGTKDWGWVKSSADGYKLASFEWAGYIYTSVS